jgi:hypothetical protein
MQLVTVPISLLKRLYEQAQAGEYDSTSGLCHSCGHAVSPLFGEQHSNNCEWLNTILDIEAILAKDT